MQRQPEVFGLKSHPEHVDRTGTMHTLQEGEEVGPFRIVELIGRGRLGMLYLAAEPDHDRSVALRVLAPALAQDETFVQCLRINLRLLARLGHPHVVRVFHLHQVGERIVFGKAYVRGASMREGLKHHGSQSWQEALPLARHILSGLCYVHDH